MASPRPAVIVTIMAILVPRSITPNMTSPSLMAAVAYRHPLVWDDHDMPLGVRGIRSESLEDLLSKRAAALGWRLRGDCQPDRPSYSGFPSSARCTQG
jgi:hypothetical protein